MTGADGFVGLHVVRELVEQGHEVRGTHRRPASSATLRALGAEPVTADVLEPESLRDAFGGVEAVVHCAGAVGAPPVGPAWEANASGPSNVVHAAAEVGAPRVVVTSSVLALGFAPPGRAGDERHSVEPRAPLAYPRSKRAGELGALRAGAQRGVDVVVLNPGYVLGPPVDRDGSPGSSAVVGQYLRGRLPAVIGGRTNVVDVRDVAAAHVLAVSRGRPGERYVIGGHDIAWAELIERVAELSGVRQPVLVLPPAVATAARAGERVGLAGPMPAETLTAMGSDTRFSSRKAEAELGYRARPLDETLLDTISWFRARIAAGAFNGGESSMARASALVRRAERVGALGPVRVAERRLGRRLVVGAAPVNGVRS